MEWHCARVLALLVLTAVLRGICREAPLGLQRAAHSQAPGRYRPRDGDTPLQLRPYFRRWADWMLTTDKRQRIRLAMSGLAALLMVCCLVVMNSVAAAGLASTAEVRVWTACSVLGLIGGVCSHSQRLVAPLQRPGPHPGADPLRHHLLCGGVCDRRACTGRHVAHPGHHPHVRHLRAYHRADARACWCTAWWRLAWHRAWWPRATSLTTPPWSLQPTWAWW